MYTKIILTIFLLATYFNANAQTQLGFRVGKTFSQVYFVPLKNLEWQAGNNFALVFNHFSKPHFGIQLEIGIEQRGWKETHSIYKQSQVVDSIYRLNFNFYEFASLTRFSIGKNKTHLIINVGPYISYSYKASEEFYNQSARDYAFPDSTYRYTFGVLGGVAINRSFNFGTLEIEARYHQSLRNVYKPKEIITREKEISLAQSFGLAAIWYFDFKKNNNSNAQE